MSSTKGKWTEQIHCESPAEAQVTKDEFRRKGMLARIVRRPARRVGGTPIGGHWLVKARMPKNGPNQGRLNAKEPPLVIVEVPVIVKREVKQNQLDENGKHAKDWKGNWLYNIETVEEVKVESKAIRITPEDIPAFVAEAQAKVDKVLDYL